MVPKHSVSTVLASVTLFSLLLALSIYYIVNNIVRRSEDALHSNPLPNEDSDTSGKHKTIHPLTEILYQQLFEKKPLGECPVYLTNICGWKMNKRTDNKTKGEEGSKNTTKDELRQFNGIIRVCQMFGIIRYQDVCFYVRNSFLGFIPANRIASRLLQDCAYVYNKGYPCGVRSSPESEYLVPQNVCISDSATAINILTKRCRVRAESCLNHSDFEPFEDLIYEVGNDSYGNGYGDNRDEISTEGENEDKNQQYKSGSNNTQTGSNATTVVCHILLAALLVVSASVALFEVCRDRLADKKFGQHSIIGDGRISADGNHSYLLDSRRCSLVDLTVSRHARRESTQHQHQVILPESSNNNAGTSVAPRRTQTKLLGARPPPLLRRSSFPVHIGNATSIAHQSYTPKERVSTLNGAATPTKSTSRKASIDGSEGESSPDLGKRRVRFLRRY